MEPFSCITAWAVVSVRVTKLDPLGESWRYITKLLIQTCNSENDKVEIEESVLGCVIESDCTLLMLSGRTNLWQTGGLNLLLG